MLSVESADVVRATLPVVGAAIGDITPIFYRRMFAAHPELERDLFNRGNQAQGDQQRALAGAIAAYATLLVSENVPQPDDLLARIANKHASLGIIADQYEIVHKHLFEAIVEVLGEAVTPEVAAAWDEVYWEMARALISIEDGLYRDAGVEPGQVWQRLVVTRRVQESPDTVSFVLANPDGTTLPAARPGQYVSVAVRLPDGARQIRQYSLTRAPERTSWGITVKAIGPSTAEDGTEIPAGEVSVFLHHNVFEGDELDVSLPFGDLVLDDSSDPLLLISAGIGCTPIIGMLHYLARTETDRYVTVLHADRAPSRHAHRQELVELVDRLPGAKLHHWYEDLGVRPATDTTRLGRIDMDEIEIRPDSRVYLCGPLPFMESVRTSLLARNVPEGNIRYEVFGPDKWLP
ncbi:flavohemoprotein [Rhodococcus aetherivorans]|uniref:nitric oxide dioxygenase n=3 Tax=Rhodococcus TaxID=1827 RepID=A0ABQ0YLT4_9NOCA|nr:globin domain-containing protein [Rhodococcus aetherivorans]ETT29024.1 Nitric oxide dioxygenase [Rhodococcus rhodochrous ATCC 21198]KDE12199.1 hemin transporter [Rhodococcus aetherivorans]NGP28548.1 hemin transporter [Rhodococcus aetherivorans]WKW97564.1 FAD-binding oxidoreductase [Rhodococcus aetherivorans]CCW09831.1 Flavohemoprotein (Hemoglobin-like protein) (Flavohemoglobin) (Nitric oxide dioxygenase [Rhodococcus aetherivorans]